MGNRGIWDIASEAATTGTAKANGALWGSSARDWAEIQEGQFKAGYQAVLDHCGVGPHTDYLDAALGAALAPFQQADGSVRIGARCRFLVARV